MKHTHFLITLLFIASLTAFVSAQSPTDEHSKMHKSSDTSLMKDARHRTAKGKYTCPMHSDVVSDKPGKCLECGMDLKKKVRTKAETKSASYVCPMHSDVVSDKPGKCPKCGMDLKKTDMSKVETHSASYVCPMHSDVVSDKPDKCPECGMKLVKAKSSPNIKKSHKMHKDTSMPHPDKMH